MMIKWHFSNDTTPQFSEIPAFTRKSKWKSPKGNPKLEVFLNQIKKNFFELAETPLGYLSFSKEECQAMSSLTNNTSIVIKKADKGSCVVVWDNEDCKANAENQLRDKNVYKNINFKEKFLQELAETTNSSFGNFKKGL